jgi:adenosine deaminase
MAEHPLPRMLARGLRVSVHSDDPAYFGGYVDDNVDSIRTHLGLGSAELETLARNAVDAAFVDETRRRQLHGEIDEWAAHDETPTHRKLGSNS